MIINNEIYDISVKCFFKSILKNYNIPNIDIIKDDLISEGCLAILTHDPLFKNLDSVSLFKARYSVAKKAMYNFIYANVTKLSKVSSFEDFNLFSGDLSDFLVAPESNNFDFNFIYEKFMEFLLKLPVLDKSIVYDYVVLGLSKKDILKKHNIKNNYFISVIRNFRFSLSNYLKNFNFFISYSSDSDEFAPTESQKRKALKKEALSKNKLIYFDDLLIYKLMRENPQNNYSKFLNLSIDYLNKILNRQSWVYKLKSYQVQQLRKKFFKSYDLENLLSVVKYA